MQTHKPEPLRLLRRKAPRKRSAGSSEGMNEKGPYTDGDLRRSWFGRIMRLDEDRLVRKVLLNCVQPTKESLYGDVPDIDVERAIEIARDREKVKNHRQKLSQRKPETQLSMLC